MSRISSISWPGDDEKLLEWAAENHDRLGFSSTSELVRHAVRDYRSRVQGVDD